ncbi:WD 40 repeat-like protein, partial [Moniliophthora roreri MCA 2997]
MADPKLWTKFDSTDIEDAAETGRLHSMRPRMPRQRHCNCVHDVLPHTPGARPSRNLVVCIDGTANQFSDKNTNVVELYSRLEKSEHLQVTFYNSGIGTYASPSWKSLTYYKQVMYHKIDLAVAWRFEKILLSAYQWLCEQYQTGDRIFLFGFSRGAYQVRALSAMIEKVGLIHRGNEAQIPFAYDLYRQTAERSAYKSDTKAKTGLNNKKGSEKIKSQLPPEDTPKHKDQSLSNEKKISESGSQANKSEHAGPKAAAGELSKPEKQKPDDYIDNAARFKRTFCRTDAKVHFVGVWDTVSSVGFAKKKELPLTAEGMEHVCLFRHALALDERRVKFLPEFVNGGAGPKVDDQKKSASEMPHTKEVWFSGTHSDIGGGNIENKGLNNNGPALRWMITEASKAGLLLTPFSWKWDEVRTAKAFNESLTGFWRVLEILPIKRSLYEVQDETTRRPHMGARRKILEGQLVHRSVYGSDRLHLEYQDHLKPWDGKDPSRIEPDKFDQVTHHIEYAIDLLSNMDMKASGQRYHHLSHLNHTSFMFGTDEAIQAYINLSHALFYPVNLDDPAIQQRT